MVISTVEQTIVEREPIGKSEQTPDHELQPALLSPPSDDYIDVIIK
jgi:hypothetical protein